MAPSLTYRRLKAPRHDGGALIDPDWPTSLSLAQINASRLSEVDFDLLGRSFQSLRAEARADFLRLASSYTNHYTDADCGVAETPVIVSGHQPELFHPGVWAKTFAIDSIARQTRGVAVQIIVDSDICRDHALRVPTGDATQPRVVSEPYDQFDAPIPFELRKVRDIGLFRTFAQRVTARIEKLVPHPLVQDIWPDAMDAVRAGRPLGHAFAQARHRLERAWGLRTLEVPLSVVCETPAFRWFLLGMLVRGQEVLESHNRYVQQYRRLHRIRNAAQPVPDLRQTEGWTEAPFWIWTQHDPRRRPLWWQWDRQNLVVSDRESRSWVVEKPARDAREAVHRLCELSQAGLRIRPRALSNTLFARLFLSDLFTHGIGGAKYDQITDCWIADLFSIPPPGHLTLSLTLHLPIEHESVPPSEVVAAGQRLRELQFHPERFFSAAELDKYQVSHWVRVKSRWIQQSPPRGKRLARHRGIAEANAELRYFLQEKHEEQQQRLAHLRERLAACRILESREWSFCLFPPDYLREKLLDLGRLSS